MDETEGRFKVFIQQMSKVIFNLLDSLNIEYHVASTRQAVDLFIFNLFIQLSFLDLQTHIATDSSYIFSFRQIFIHFHDSFSFWPQTNI